MPDRFDEFLYIIAHLDLVNEKWVGPVKIGISGNPAARVDQLQSGNPHRIGVYAKAGLSVRSMTRDLESIAHNHFKEVRLAGEWFDVNPEEALLWLNDFGRTALLVIGALAEEAGKPIPRACFEALEQTDALRSKADEGAESE